MRLVANQIRRAESCREKSVVLEKRDLDFGRFQLMRIGIGFLYIDVDVDTYTEY